MSSESTLTILQRQKMGQFQLTKGNDTKGRPIVQWDFVQPCDPDACVMREECPYTEGRGKCKSELAWIKTFVDMMQREFPEMNEDQRYMLGTFVLPAVRELHTLYLYVASIPRHRVFILNQQGNWKAHAVFDDVRKQRSHITHLLKEFGFDPKRVRLPTNPIPPAGSNHGYQGPTRPNRLTNPNLRQGI